MKHKTVLPGEAINLLNIEKGDVVVDATLGSGGHVRAITKKIGKEGKVVALDADKNAIDQFKKEMKKEGRERELILVHDNFKNIAKVIKDLRIEKVDAILADLGWRAEQMSDSAYGLSFQKEGRLDMRYDRQSAEITAHEIINQWRKEELEDIFGKYGEEKEARRIADTIVKQRKEKAIETTTQLAQLIEEVKRERMKIHPATKIFQALRIVVNNELENLEKFLKESLTLLKKNGRISVITFHSLEDRIVKEFFRTNAGGCVCPKNFPQCVCGAEKRLKIVTKKPIRPGKDEMRANPRARSAKLRVAEKI